MGVGEVQRAWVAGVLAAYFTLCAVGEVFGLSDPGTCISTAVYLHARLGYVWTHVSLILRRDSGA